MSGACLLPLSSACHVQDAAASRFQLPDEDGDEAGGEGLTHMGRSLSDFDTFPGRWPMLSDIYSEFHPRVMLSARGHSTEAAEWALARGDAGKQVPRGDDESTGAGSGSDSDADAALDAEATATLNFGGGFVRKAPGSASAEAERPKTKKEVGAVDTTVPTWRCI